MGYKGLIIKLQKLYAHYDYKRHQDASKSEYDLICKEIDNILTSEKYAMKRHFKY